MYSHDELRSLHGFIKATGEGNLKKMVVGGSMTEAHLRMLVKVARSVSEDEFVTHFESDSFPKVKFSGAEIGLKEGFWAICGEGFERVGLLTKSKAA